MPQLKDILKSINTTKDADLIDEFNESDYSSWVVNRALSFYPDTVLQANELNQRPHISREMSYKYLLYSIRKKNRYSPWLKSSASPEVLLIKEYFGYSTKKAKEVLPMFSKQQFEELKILLDKGGCKK